MAAAIKIRKRIIKPITSPIGDPEAYCFYEYILPVLLVIFVLLMILVLLLTLL
jgi:hypothetical protein